MLLPLSREPFFDVRHSQPRNGIFSCMPIVYKVYNILIINRLFEYSSNYTTL